MSTPIDFVRGFLAYSKRASEVDALSRLVLFSICFLADNTTGQCQVSNLTLAEESGCALRTVIRRIQKLERIGVISVVRSDCAPSIITLLGYQEWINSDNYNSKAVTISVGRFA